MLNNPCVFSEFKFTEMSMWDEAFGSEQLSKAMKGEHVAHHLKEID